MNILQIANFSNLGGGITVQVKYLLQKLNMERINSIYFNTKKSWVKRLFILPIQLFRIGRNQDVFHVHGCSYAGFYPIIIGVIVGRLLKKKIIVTYHGGDAKLFFKSYPKLTTFFLNKADKIIVQSNYLAHVFKDIGIETYTIPNIIEFDASLEFKPPTASPHIITTRSLKNIYDIGTAIEAFSIVQASFPDAFLYILGTGPEEEKLKEMVKKRGIKNVNFAGFVNNEEIYLYLRKAHFWCNPTTKDNMPVSLLEAINAGLIVISTNVGGIPYMVEHKKSAWLVNEKAPADIANAIIYLTNNPQVSENLIENARATLHQYSWENIKSKLIPIYLN